MNCHRLRHCILLIAFMEQNEDIIIIGAGICGLALAEKLAKKGKKVLVLEALERAGGRINTIRMGNLNLEAGPEFIHGDLPLTQQLIKRAGMNSYLCNGEVYRSKHDSVYIADDFIPHMKRVIKAFKELVIDITLQQFLETHFTSDSDKELRDSIIRQAEGFDVADPARVSVFALRDEWSKGHEETYMISEGYGSLTDYLKTECEKAGCRFVFSKEVCAIEWKAHNVLINCCDESTYAASKVIVTVPLGVLSSVQGNRGHIEFEPPVPHLVHAAREMGFGTVVKAVMVFNTAFWDNKDFEAHCQQIPDLGFLINETAFPVFWTGSENNHSVITGWAGGPLAEKLHHYTDEELKETALFSLASALRCKETLIKEQLLEIRIFNWSREPYTRGAYSYSTPQTIKSKKLFSEPLLNTVYFAGESFGKDMGTVEAALESAEETAKKII